MTRRRYTMTRSPLSSLSCCAIPLGLAGTAVLESAEIGVYFTSGVYVLSKDDACGGIGGAPVMANGTTAVSGVSSFCAGHLDAEDTGESCGATSHLRGALPLTLHADGAGNFSGSMPLLLLPLYPVQGGSGQHTCEQIDQ